MKLQYPTAVTSHLIASLPCKFGLRLICGQVCLVLYSASPVFQQYEPVVDVLWIASIGRGLASCMYAPQTMGKVQKQTTCGGS